jgi:hypothetical protein
MRIAIAVNETQSTISAIVQCTKATNLTYTAAVSIINSGNETYTALTQVDSTDYGDGTQELIFTGNVATPGNIVTLKITTVNTSGSTATISKILGGVE